MRKLLIIDDDAEVALLLKAKFEKAGDFEVVLATDGEDAVALAASEAPDIIICDVDMPGMDGATVMAELEKQDATKKIPFLYLSSLVTPKDVARGVKAGGKTMLSKQSPVKDLIHAIDDALFKAKR